MAVLAGLANTEAQVFFRESFAGTGYTPGATLNDRDGGLGFAGAWWEGGRTSDLDEIQAGSLAFGSVETSGNSVSSFAPNDLYSDLSRPITALTGTSGATLWVSYLFRKDSHSASGSPVAEDYFGLVVYGTTKTTGDGLFFGDPGETATFALSTVGVPSSGSEISAVPVVLGSTAFLVARIDFLNGTDSIKLFVNPDPAGPAPTAANATKTDLDLGDISDIGIVGGPDATWSLDEIRAGATFDAVVPEPLSATWVLGACVLFAVIRRYRALER